MEKLNKKINFLLEMGRSLHYYGTNAPRLELTLTNIAESIGLTGSFFSTPTYLAISIDDGTGGQLTRHIRVSPSDVNLAKITMTAKIADEVSSGDLNISDAMKQLKLIHEMNTSYGVLLTIISFGFISAALGCIFGASFSGVLSAGLIGTVLGIFSYLTTRVNSLGDLFEIIAAAICTAMTYIAQLIFPSINSQVVLMASLIAIVPGLGITIALNEIAAKNLVSGTARLMGAVVGLIKISFGVMAIIQLMEFFGKSFMTNTTKVNNDLFLLPAVLFGALSFGVIFQARLKDFKWIILSACVAIFSIKFFNIYFSDIISILLGSMCVGIGSNIYARAFRKPAMVPLLPGIIFLVPGSIGYTGMNLIFNTQYSQGVNTAYQMFIIAMTIVTGLFFSSIFVNPRGSL